MTVLVSTLGSAKTNKKYRRYRYTDPKVQIVEMFIPKGGGIPQETHSDVTQIFIVISGRAIFILRDPGAKWAYTKTITRNELLVVPFGTEHQLITDADVNLITFYSPMEHPDAVDEDFA